MEVQLVKISSLKLLENNPRTITKEQMQKLCKSIQDDPNFLICRPVLVNSKSVLAGRELIVYAGNQRVRAAKKLKMKEIPCIIETDLCEEIMKKRTILDNKTFGSFDFDMLLNEYDNDILLDCGFTLPELTGENISVSGEDLQDEGEEVEPPKDPKTKLGDLYELGSHRLKCGDSTNSADVMDLLAGAIPVLMVTDPPYGVSYDPEKKCNIGEYRKNKGKVTNDHIFDWTESYKLFPGNVAYVWHASSYTDKIKNNIESIGFKIFCQIIWAKPHFSLGREDYHFKHEPCWYAYRTGSDRNWQGARDQSTLWEIDNKRKNEDESTTHSTQKPIECMAKPIRNNTAEGEGVYDPFLGSGTTLIAAEKLNRICYGLEIDPGYCDIIVQRWCKLTSKKAKRNGEEIDEL